MSDTVGILSLFISSFLAATLLPGGSEAALFAVLKAYPETLWYALVIASIGNTLGGMVTFGMGWLLPQTQQLKHVKKVRLRHGGAEPSSAGEAATHPLAQLSDFDRNVLRVRRYGTPALMLAWVPLIGDAFCLAAGWLRLNPWQAALFMAIGKFARYGLIAFAMS
jgi:membrane protein YqaA with SNARE-associated domain